MVVPWAQRIFLEKQYLFPSILSRLLTPPFLSDYGHLSCSRWSSSFCQQRYLQDLNAPSRSSTSGVSCKISTLHTGGSISPENLDVANPYTLIASETKTTERREDAYMFFKILFRSQ